MGFSRLLRSGTFLGIALFLFSAGFPPLDGAAEVDLTVHMLQHILIILAGVAVAYPLLGRRILRESRGGLFPLVGLGAAILIVVFWHLPDPWDSAVLSPGVHVAEHLSFLTVGLLSGSVLLGLTDSAKIGALMAAFFGHMAYAVVLISPWNQQVYALYSLPDQALLGWVLLLTGPSLLAGVAYIVASNPAWLAGFEGRAGAGEGRRQTALNKVRVPSWTAPVLTALLVVAAAGYFTYVAYALGSQGQVNVAGPVVYIQETPVSWQYSPQNIKVMLGVNSTVTWVSRSLSYDSVTGDGGTFGSGPIAPGQTFAHMFDQPGVYEYHCQYHPWMTGSVTVLPGP